MADPAGITRRTVTVDCSTAFETAEDLGATITATSTVPSLVWAATGGRIVSDRRSNTADPGGVAQLELIPSDLTGWTLGGEVVDVDPTNGKYSHAYDITVQPTRADGPRVTPVGAPIVYRNVIVPSGTTALDLDMAVQAGTPVDPITLPANFTVPIKGTPTDGQLMGWSATLNAWTPVNPSGKSELASAQNATGTVQTIASASGGGAGTIVDIANCSISVPSSAGRPVTIEASATFNQAATGQGLVYMLLYETTSGNVLQAYRGGILPNVAGAWGVNVGLPTVRYRIPAGVSTTRTFKLSSYVYGASGATPSANITNNAANPSWIRAEAG